MTNSLFITIVLVLVVQISFAKEVSLVDDTTIPLNNFQAIQDSLGNIDDQENLEDMGARALVDDFEETSDFVRQENEKLKDIKLLNLDLEKADLILKKKEIDQKINQIKNTEILASGREDASESETTSSFSNIKLMGVFMGGALKTAILNINGVNRSVQEGQQIVNSTVKNINQEKVSIQFEDGQTQEIHFL